MDYKEKLKDIINSDKTPFVDINTFLKYFPELKENKNEEIRKELIRAFKSLNTIKVWNGIERTEILAWLEKKGEQNSFDYENANIQQRDFAPKSALEALKEEKVDNANKVVIEPKFHEGEWIIFNGLTLYVKEVVNGFYRTISKGGIPNSYDWNIDNVAKLWTIQDAKDGDVLVFKNNIGGIIICKFPTYYDTRSYCRLISDNFINKEESGWDSTLLVPATKEQRDLLFQKMKEAGYTFDFEKKELKKIEQKTAWNEEDKETLQTIINDLSEELNEETDKEEQEILSAKISFLQSLKPRPIHKWSREDNRTRLEITDFLECHKMEEPTRVDILNKWIAWIANLEPQWKQKSAWSEEDETGLTNTIIMLKEGASLHFNKKDITKAVNWLKSLRTRESAVEE